MIAILLAVSSLKTTDAKPLSYTTFLQDVKARQVSTAQISNGTGEINGKLKNGATYQVQGPSPSLPNDVTEMRDDGVSVSFPTPATNLLSDLLPYICLLYTSRCV